MPASECPNKCDIRYFSVCQTKEIKIQQKVGDLSICILKLNFLSEKIKIKRKNLS